VLASEVIGGESKGGRVCGDSLGVDGGMA